MVNVEYRESSNPHERHPHPTTTSCKHGCHPRQGHEAGDGGASLAVGAWFPLSAESSTVAGEAGYCDAEVQDVYLRKRLLLAWTRGSNATS